MKKCCLLTASSSRAFGFALKIVNTITNQPLNFRHIQALCNHLLLYAKVNWLPQGSLLSCLFVKLCEKTALKRKKNSPLAEFLLDSVSTA